MKNYNQITIPVGTLLILTAVFMGAFLPKWNMTIEPLWIAFCATLGTSFVLFSIETIPTVVAGSVFLIVAFVLFAYAI